MRIEPPPSEAWAKGRMPVATAAPAPPLEPPGVLSVFQGLRLGPNSRGSVTGLISDPPVPEVVGDIDGDGAVTFQDLLILLGTWGTCPDPPAECPADIDGNGKVDFTDLLILLGNWG